MKIVSIIIILISIVGVQLSTADLVEKDAMNFNKIERNIVANYCYYPPMHHLLLETGIGVIGGIVSMNVLGSIIHPNKNTDTSGEPSDIYRPYDMSAIFCTSSALSVYAVGRALKTRGSLVWTASIANAIPTGIMAYGFINGKPDECRSAVYVASIFAPLMATIAYNVTAVQQSKKDIKYSCNSTINTCIAWKSNDITKKANPYIIIQYNF